MSSLEFCLILWKNNFFLPTYTSRPGEVKGSYANNKWQIYEIKSDEPDSLVKKNLTFHRKKLFWFHNINTNALWWLNCCMIGILILLSTKKEIQAVALWSSRIFAPFKWFSWNAVMSRPGGGWEVTQMHWTAFHCLAMNPTAMHWTVVLWLTIGWPCLHSRCSIIYCATETEQCSTLWRIAVHGSTVGFVIVHRSTCRWSKVQCGVVTYMLV